MEGFLFVVLVCVILLMVYWLVLEMIKRWKRADVLVEESNRSDIKEEELR